MDNLKDATWALVIFEAARMRLGHATARPHEVKKIHAENLEDLFYEYCKIMRSAYEDEVTENFPPVLPTVDMLSHTVSHTTCTRNSVLVVRLGGRSPKLSYLYSGEIEDTKIVVGQLMSLRFDWRCSMPVSAALLWLRVNNVFSIKEIMENEKIFRQKPRFFENNSTHVGHYTYREPTPRGEYYTSEILEKVEDAVEVLQGRDRDGEKVAEYYNEVVVLSTDDDGEKYYEVWELYTGEIATYISGSQEKIECEPFRVLTKKEGQEFVRSNKFLFDESYDEIIENMYGGYGHDDNEEARKECVAHKQVSRDS